MYRFEGGWKPDTIDISDSASMWCVIYTMPEEEVMSVVKVLRYKSEENLEWDKRTQSSGQ